VRDADEALHPTPERQKLYDEGSAITHLTADDPPLYMVYNEADGPLPADAKPGQGIHHPNFGRQLKAKMDELKIENVFVYQPNAPGRNVAAEMLEFFQKQFAKVNGEQPRKKFSIAMSTKPQNRGLIVADRQAITE
jgi:acetyl esterase